MNTTIDKICISIHKLKVEVQKVIVSPETHKRIEEERNAAFKHIPIKTFYMKPYEIQEMAANYVLETDKKTYLYGGQNEQSKHDSMVFRSSKSGI